MIQIKIESHILSRGFFLLMGMGRNIHSFYLKSTMGIIQFELTCFHKECFMSPSDLNICKFVMFPYSLNGRWCFLV